MPSELTHISVTHTHALAAADCVVIAIFRVDTTTAAIEAQRKLASEVAKSRKRRVGLLTVLEETCPNLSEPTRHAMLHLLRDLTETAAGSAVALEGGGFKASLIRSMVTGVNLIARSPFPNRVFSSVPDASVWLWGEIAKAQPVNTTSADLSAAVELLRARIPA